jgi:hypothetical protein
MDNSDIILTEFKNGDDQHRMDLYMYNRNLRSDFEQIEHEEINSLEPESTFARQDVLTPSRAKDRRSTFVKMKRWCFSILS